MTPKMKSLDLVSLVGNGHESLVSRRRNNTRQVKDLSRSTHPLERACSTAKKFVKRSNFAENIASPAAAASTAVFILSLDMDMLAAIDILVTTVVKLRSYKISARVFDGWFHDGRVPNLATEIERLREVMVRTIRDSGFG
jgi:hypothetical protein